MKYGDRLEGKIRAVGIDGGTRSLRWNPLACVLAILLCLFSPVVSSGVGLDESFYIADGPVYDTTTSGSTIYIGGDFERLGALTGSGVAVDPGTAVPVSGFPQVRGDIYAIVSDGENPNGWYISGSFTHVDGEEQPLIAHILPDKTLDPEFNPFADADDDGEAEINGLIKTMILDGTTLYIGGYFTVVEPSINGLAAIDTGTSTVNSSWIPDPTVNASPSGIDTMVLSGSMLYVAGPFTSIGDQEVVGLAAIETLSSDANSTGDADETWIPDVEDGFISAMTASGGHLYVGGTFAGIGGETRSGIAAVEMIGTGDDTGRAHAAWNPAIIGPASLPPGSITALHISGDVLYIGGAFTSVGGLARGNLAAIDSVGVGDGTGQVNATWDPNVTSEKTDPIRRIIPDATGSRLFVCGSFSHVGGTQRSHIAAIDAVGTGDGTGDVDAAWSMDLNQSANSMALSVDGALLYVGGFFERLFNTARNRIAAIDKATGLLADWNPGANGVVRSLLVSGNTLYVGGSFTTIGGKARNRIAAIDTTIDTDNATDWDPGADADVLTMILDGTTLYAGGDFTQIGGAGRNRIAALDTLTDTSNATDWNPDADDTVKALLLNATTLYVGGDFTAIGGSDRSRLAALDTAADTDNASDWNPGIAFADDSASTVNTLVLDGTTLYVGGEFDTAGGSERNNIAALDTATNTDNAASWDPNLDAAVHDMHLTSPNLYVVGKFTYSGGDGVNDEDDPGGVDQGVFHGAMVVLDINREVSPDRSWNPSFANNEGTREVFTVLRDGFDLLFGGTFDSVMTRAINNIARVRLAGPTVTINLESGTYPKEQFAWIDCEPATGFQCDVGYYTLDGTDPTTESERIVAGGVYIEKTSTLKVMIVDNAGTQSPIATASYTIESEDAVCFIDTASDHLSTDALIKGFGRFVDSVLESGKQVIRRF